jgi:hypothetical protein
LAEVEREHENCASWRSRPSLHDSDLPAGSRIVPVASVGRLAAGERSISKVKSLAERRKERSGRSQSPNGRPARLRHLQAGTNARGAKWSQGRQVAITERSVRWFRRVLVAELHIKRLIPDRLGDSIIKSQPPQLPEIRSKRQNNWRSKT